MEKKEFLSLLADLLKDEVVGSVEEKDGEITVTFLSGETRTIIVK